MKLIKMKLSLNNFKERFTKQEIIDILIADTVLILAFTLILSTKFGGIFSISNIISNTSLSSFLNNFFIYLSISAFVVSISFIIHELMHKFVAQYYGAIAGFRTSINGLMITIVSSLFGFLIGIPGATMIYAQNFSKKQEGIVSLAGPLTNFAMFGIFLFLNFIIHPNPESYLGQLIYLTFFINILLALYNMLPIFPLDGSKIFIWNKPLYISMMALIFILTWFFIPSILYLIVFMVIIALIFSLLYKQIL